jgi:GT2 family glycosyltransferase
MDKMGNEPKVGVVLVNWNGADFTVPCLQSLAESDYSHLVTIVVDDASTDASPGQIARCFPGSELLRQTTQIGVWQARNRGMERALQLGCEYVMLLDNDTRVDRSLISCLVAAARQLEDSAAVGPKIYYLRDPRRLWYAYGYLSLRTGIYSNPVYNVIDEGQFDQQKEMEIGSSCCLLIPRGILGVVGGFDASYGVYGCGDVDWSLRCRSAGFKLVYCPQGKVWHWVGGSAHRMPRAMIRYLTTRNQIWTLRKIATPSQLATVIPFYPLRCLFRLARSAFRREWDCIPAELKGAKEGFLGRIPWVDTPPGGRRPQKQELAG